MAPDHIDERWLPVVGFEGLYEVSDHGRVRSLDRVRLQSDPKNGKPVVRRHLKGKLLSPGTVKSGHKIVILGRGNSRLVHTLVLTAFVGPRPPGFDTCHYDGDPANNHLSNLRWGTRADNVHDMLRHGTYRGGAKPGRSPNATLRSDQIPEIRRLIAAGLSNDEIGARFGVSRSAIYMIRAGRNWTHVPDEAAA